MRLLSFDIEDRMKSIGWYQMLGGIFGVIVVSYSLILEGTLTGFNFLLFSIAYFLFGFSIYCGNLLRKTNLKGLKLSLINQFLQIFQIAIGPIAFIYSSGIRFSLGFNWTENLMPDFVISLSGFSIKYNPSDSSELSVLINLIPIIIIYFINKIEKDISDRKELMDEAEKMSRQYNSNPLNLNNSTNA